MFPFQSDYTDPPRSGDKTCYIYAWIGQSFEFCDDCGKPYWKHPYRYALGGSRGDFRVKRYLSYCDKWEWANVVIITQEEADQMQYKWEGYYEAKTGVKV